MGHYLWGVERVKRFVNVHLHCIVSNLKKISKMSMWHKQHKQNVLCDISKMSASQIEAPICTGRTIHQFIRWQQQKFGALGGSPMEWGLLENTTRFALSPQRSVPTLPEWPCQEQCGSGFTAVFRSYPHKRDMAPSATWVWRRGTNCWS